MTSEDDDTVVGSAMWRSAAVKMNRRLWDMSRRGRTVQQQQGVEALDGKATAGQGDAGRRQGGGRAG